MGAPEGRECVGIEVINGTAFARIRNTSSSSVALRLYDLKGTMLWSKELPGTQTAHLPGRLASGTYLLQMHGAEVGRKVYEFVR